MTITTALPNQINIIQQIAKETWPVAYGGILSKEQLEYMLDKFYSVEKLNKDFASGQQFLLAQEDGNYYGFAAFEHDFEQKQRTHIHKIYVLPQSQGKSVGKMLMHVMEQFALKFGSDRLTLNVNRYNTAREFYTKAGFEIVDTVDISIGQGYLMEDYLMRKMLQA